MTVIHVCSVSGGKDSAATLALMLERVPRERCKFIFCDTGNEHAAVYAYLGYLEHRFSITIDRLTASFSGEIARKREFIARDARKREFIARDARTRREYETRPVFEPDGETPVPKRDERGRVVLDKKGEPIQKTVKTGGGKRVRWTNKAKRRALANLYPTGNPFLDLCMWKGRFPSRKAQFCTEQLKRGPADEYVFALTEQGHRVISWQGVRRDESQNRANAKFFERVGPGWYVSRPLIHWSAANVFSYCALKNIEPNPLYLQGMGRVGCMPCINANKAELRQIGGRFGDHINRISAWEYLVALCSKRGGATFIPALNKGKPVTNSVEHAAAGNIHSIIRWANTKRGGKVLDDSPASTGCASSYGLCDRA